MGYPPPPPPPGQPGGYGPPPGAPGYGAPPPGPGYGPPPGSPPGGGYGGPPPGGGYGGPPGGYAPTPPPSSGSSKKPLIFLMAALVVVVLLAVVGGLVLLSADGDDTVELTESERTDALITTDDLGDGWTEDEASDTESTSEDFDGSQECLDLLDRLEEEGTNPFSESDDPPGTIERSFTDDTSGASVQHGLAPEIGAVDAYRDLLESCEELTFEEDDAPVDVTLSEGDTYDIGDDSVTTIVSFSFEDAGETFEFDSYVVVWTDRGTDGFLAFSPGGDDEGNPVAIDEGFVEDTATAADERLSEVIDEA